jgi:hypothetical protein
MHARKIMEDMPPHVHHDGGNWSQLRRFFFKMISLAHPRRELMAHGAGMGTKVPKTKSPQRCSAIWGVVNLREFLFFLHWLH